MTPKKENGNLSVRLFFQGISSLCYLIRHCCSCEQFLFCSKIRGEEHQTSERASVTASITREHAIQVVMPRVASSASVSPAVDRSLVLCSSLRSWPRIFVQKRVCSQFTLLPSYLFIQLKLVTVKLIAQRGYEAHKRTRFQFLYLDSLQQLVFTL